MKIGSIDSVRFGLRPLQIKTPNMLIDFIRDNSDKVISYSVRDNQGRLIKEFSKTQNGNKTSLLIDEYQYNHDFVSVKDIRRIVTEKSADGRFITVTNKSINNPSKSAEIYLKESGRLDKACISGESQMDNYTVINKQGKILKIYG